MSVVFDALAEFGSQIMNPIDGVAILEPVCDINADQLVELVMKPQGDPESPLEVGIFNVLPHLLAYLWKDMTEEQREAIKSQLLKALSFNLHVKSDPRVADACIEVFNNCEKKWDALVDAVFSDNDKRVQGFLFVRFVQACEPAFVEQNLDRIVEMVAKLLPQSPCYVQTGLMVILSGTDVSAAFKARPQLLELVWGAVLHIVTDEPEWTESIIPVIADLCEDAPELENETPKCVESAIEAIHDVKSAQPVMHVVSFLSGPLLVKLLEKLNEVATVETKDEVPVELIKMIDEAPFDMISDERMKLVSDLVKSKIDSAAGLVLFAPLSAHIATTFGPDNIWAVVEKCLSQDPLHICLGLKVFECISNYTDDLDFDLPDSLMYKFVEFLTHELESVKSAAFATLGSLIENDAFIHTDQVERLVKVYPSIVKPDLIRFFKLLRKVLRVEGLSDDVIVMLFKFAMSTVTESSDVLVRAQCLSIISCVASQDADDLVVEEIKKLSPIAVELMKSDDPAGYSYASRVLVLFVSIAPDVCRRSVLSLLPKFFSISEGASELSVKIQANVAVALASILVRLNIEKDFQKLVDIVKRFVESHENHLISAAAVITEILRSAKAEINLKLYHLLASVALEVRDCVVFNALLNALRKILKSYEVPEDETLPLYTSILTGAHPIFNRRPPSIFTDKQTKIFSYLLAVAIRYPSQVERIAPAIVSWLTKAPPFMVSSYLELIEHLVEQKAVKGDAASQTVRILLNHIGLQRGTLEEVVAGIVMMIMKQDPNAVDKNELIAQFCEFWKKPNKKDSKGWRAQVGTGILELVALGATAEDDVINEIIATYPPDEEFGQADNMSLAIITILDDTTEKWNQVLPAAIRAFVNVLMLKKEERDALHIEASTAQKMKVSLKQALAKNPAIEREIRRGFQKNRPQMNRYNGIFK